jgi:hypothetical protein
MKNITKIIAAAAVAVAITQAVQATPITGNIGFSGSCQLDSSSVSTATEVVSWAGTTVTPLSVSGSFLGFISNAGGTPVTMTGSAWTFASGALPGFWSVGGFTFNLASSSVFSNAGGFLNVVIAGTVVGNGYDATAFSGTFQVSNPSANGATQFTERLSFSSVPDGGTTALLLGSALSGLALLRRKLNI